MEKGLNFVLSDHSVKSLEITEAETKHNGSEQSQLRVIIRDILLIMSKSIHSIFKKNTVQ